MTAQERREFDGMLVALCQVEKRLAALEHATRERCTCGGSGPNDEGACPACLVWHDVKKA